MTDTISEPAAHAAQAGARTRTRDLALRHAPLAAMLAFYAFVLVRTAWINDDASITFRCVDNFLHGYGMRYNVAERVQAFTHPLWFFVLSPLCFVTREYFFTPIILSIALSLLSVGVFFFRLAKNAGWALIAGAAFVASRGFVDYSTSGLENPLTHMLLVVFALLFLRQAWTPRGMLAMSFTAALVVLNRMDCLLFVAPALLCVWWKERSIANTLRMAAGFLPFVLWEIFSVIYYGVPFPNTAYAKLGTGIPGGEMALHGLYYFGHSFATDPVLLPAIGAGLLAPLFSRRMRDAALAAGVALYLLYIVKIGGDFMAGRFFTAPLLMSMVLLCRAPVSLPMTAALPVAAAMLGVSALFPSAPFLTGRDFSGQFKDIVDAHGIGDERRYYYPGCGLLRWDGVNPMPQHRFAQEGREIAAAGTPKVMVKGSVGMRALMAGPGLHMIDYYGLSDPLIARLPALYDPRWRIGHFAREVPRGYRESAGALGTPNRIADADLAYLYDKLSIVTRGPIWTAERWRTIRDLNLGRYNALVDWDAYRFAGIRKVEAAAVATPHKAGERSNAPGLAQFAARGIEVKLGEQHARGIELSLNGAQPYRVLFMRAGIVAGDFAVGPAPEKGGGLALYELAVPLAIAAGGYDAVRVIPVNRNAKNHVLGHLRVAG